VRTATRRFRLSLALYAAPLAFAAAVGPKRLLGYYAGIANFDIRPGAIAHWLGADAMMLAYAAGLALVPGALVGLIVALRRPQTRDEGAFGALAVGLFLALFAEALAYATNGSARFQERYLMVLLPLVFPAFWVWVKRGRPGARVVALVALAFVALSARVPLSGYTIGDAKQDSPFLLGVFRLEKAVGIGDGSLVVALVAGALACLAAGAALRARLVPVAVAASLAASCAVSIGAVSFDHHVVRSVRSTYLPPDAQWIDHAGLGDATLIQTPATPHARAHEQLFWNRSLKRLAFLDAASPIDAFGSPRVHVARDGRLVSDGKTLRGPVVISNYAVRARIVNAVAVARGADYELWRPLGTPRMALFVGGLYFDGWLANSGHLTLWPGRDGRVDGTLSLPLSLPAGTQRTVLQLRGPGVRRQVTVLPRRQVLVKIAVSHRGPWTLNFHTNRPGYLGDERPISVQAQLPTFSGNFCGTAPPTAV
jgi:hypothetical protein